MIKQFTYYLRDGASHSERVRWISDQTGEVIDPEGEVAEGIGRPFYEVGLKCTIDTETGDIKILGVV